MTESIKNDDKIVIKHEEIEIDVVKCEYCWKKLKKSSYMKHKKLFCKKAKENDVLSNRHISLECKKLQLENKRLQLQINEINLKYDKLTVKYDEIIHFLQNS
jgi:hypothetical protein